MSEEVDQSNTPHDGSEMSSPQALHPVHLSPVHVRIFLHGEECATFVYHQYRTISSIRQDLQKLRTTCDLTNYGLRLDKSESLLNDHMEFADYTEFALQPMGGEILYHPIHLELLEYTYPTALEHLNHVRSILTNPTLIVDHSDLSLIEDSGSQGEDLINSTLSQLEAAAASALKDGATAHEARYHSTDPSKLQMELAQHALVQIPVEEQYKSRLFKPSPLLQRIAMSVYNPVPRSRSLKGDLFYVDVYTLDNHYYCLTAYHAGWFVNKSTPQHFNPEPRDKEKSHRAFSLLSVILSMSPSFKAIFTENLEKAAQYAPQHNFISHLLLPESTVTASQWVANDKNTDDVLAHHHPNSYLSDNIPFQHLIYQQSPSLPDTVRNTHNTIHSIVPRDWSDEFNRAKEVTRLSTTDRLVRDQAMARTIHDFNLAAMDYVRHIVDNQIPYDLHSNKLKIYENHNFLCYSLTSFTASYLHIDEVPCSYLASKMASVELRGLDFFHKLDIPHIAQPLTCLVDYKGQRLMVYSKIIGFNEQIPYAMGHHNFETYFDLNQLPVSESNDLNQGTRASHRNILNITPDIKDRLVNSVNLLARGLHIKPHFLNDLLDRLHQKRLDSLQEDEDGDDGSTKNQQDQDRSTKPGAAPSSANSRVPLSMGTKALYTLDDRFYIHEGGAIFPRDLSTWDFSKFGPLADNSSSTLVPHLPSRVNYSHHTFVHAVVRPDLVQQYVYHTLLQNAYTEAVEKFGADPRRPPKQSLYQMTPEDLKKEQELDDKVRVYVLESIESKLDTITFNTDLFTIYDEFVTSQSANTDASNANTDDDNSDVDTSSAGTDTALIQREEEVQQLHRLSQFLHTVIIPAFIDALWCATHIITPTQLTDMMHEYGINIRYLGLVYHLCIHTYLYGQVPPPSTWCTSAALSSASSTLSTPAAPSSSEEKKEEDVPETPTDSPTKESTPEPETATESSSTSSSESAPLVPLSLKQPCYLPRIARYALIEIIARSAKTVFKNMFAAYNGYGLLVSQYGTSEITLITRFLNVFLGKDGFGQSNPELHGDCMTIMQQYNRLMYTTQRSVIITTLAEYQEYQALVTYRHNNDKVQRLRSSTDDQSISGSVLLSPPLLTSNDDEDDEKQEEVVLPRHEITDLLDQLHPATLWASICLTAHHKYNIDLHHILHHKHSDNEQEGIGEVFQMFDNHERLLICKQFAGSTGIIVSQRIVRAALIASDIEHSLFSYSDDNDTNSLFPANNEQEHGEAPPSATPGTTSSKKTKGKNPYLNQSKKSKNTTDASTTGPSTKGEAKSALPDTAAIKASRKKLGGVGFTHTSTPFTFDDIVSVTPHVKGLTPHLRDADHLATGSIPLIARRSLERQLGPASSRYPLQISETLTLILQCYNRISHPFSSEMFIYSLVTYAPFLLPDLRSRARAFSYYYRAISLAEHYRGVDSPLVAYCHVALAQALLHCSSAYAASSHLRKALSIFTINGGGMTASVNSIVRALQLDMVSFPTTKGASAGDTSRTNDHNLLTSQLLSHPLSLAHLPSPQFSFTLVNYGLCLWYLKQYHAAVSCIHLVYSYLSSRIFSHTWGAIDYYQQIKRQLDFREEVPVYIDPSRHQTAEKDDADNSKGKKTKQPPGPGAGLPNHPPIALLVSIVTTLRDMYFALDKVEETKALEDQLYILFIIHHEIQYNVDLTQNKSRENTTICMEYHTISHQFTTMWKLVEFESQARKYDQQQERLAKEKADAEKHAASSKSKKNKGKKGPAPKQEPHVEKPPITLDQIDEMKNSIKSTRDRILHQCGSMISHAWIPIAPAIPVTLGALNPSGSDTDTNDTPSQYLRPLAPPLYALSLLPSKPYYYLHNGPIIVKPVSAARSDVSSNENRTLTPQHEAAMSFNILQRLSSTLSMVNHDQMMKLAADIYPPAREMNYHADGLSTHYFSSEEYDYILAHRKVIRRAPDSADSISAHEDDEDDERGDIEVDDEDDSQDIQNLVEHLQKLPKEKLAEFLEYYKDEPKLFELLGLPPPTATAAASSSD